VIASPQQLETEPAICTPVHKKVRTGFWATVMESPGEDSTSTPADSRSTSVSDCVHEDHVPGTQRSRSILSEATEFDTAHVLSSMKFPRAAAVDAPLPIPSLLPYHLTSVDGRSMQRGTSGNVSGGMRQLSVQSDSVGSPQSVIADCHEYRPCPQPVFDRKVQLFPNAQTFQSGAADHGSSTQCESSSKSRVHSCHDCGSSFARGSHLRLHVGTVHEMKKPYRCDEPSCGALFGHVSSKYRHYRTVHLKRRDFVCAQCGLSFGEKSGLRKHELSVHIGSRPHQCDQCGFRFSFRLHLQQHIATVHEKRRPFSCDVCGHTFGQRSSLNRHLRQICRRYELKKQ
jgi:rubrerythrin